MIRWLRKIFHVDTGKLRLDAERENMRRACVKNQQAASDLIRVRDTRRVSAPALKRVHGPESI